MFSARHNSLSVIGQLSVSTLSLMMHLCDHLVKAQLCLFFTDCTVLTLFICLLTPVLTLRVQLYHSIRLEGYDYC